MILFRDVVGPAPYNRIVRKIWVLGAAILAVALAGCTQTTGTPSPTAEVFGSSAASAPSDSILSSGPASSAADRQSLDWAVELSVTDPSVVSAESSPEGSVDIKTSLAVSPESGGATSLSAMALCERAVELGATSVRVSAADGTSIVVYGDPEYGDLCTEVPLVTE